MLHLPSDDDDLTSLVGAIVPSELIAGVSYGVERALGGGAMSMAFLALRMAPEGQTRVVLKILRPAMARDSLGRAALVVRKEAVSLGRLNERVPPTPFVVRLIDTGTAYVSDGPQGGAPTLELPWLAVEHVYGGVEGTTLAERVVTSVRTTGCAFDADRAASAVGCLTRGLSAIHGSNVVHRDIKPQNVLCCGFGEDEIVKIADFGVARPAGMLATFGGIMVGTPGYAAPEQLAQEEARVGPWTDVFALAGVVYHLLTGEDYFAADTPAAAILAIHRPERRRLLGARALSPDLRARPTACAQIDAALASATAPNPDHRPQSADVFAAMVLPALRTEGSRGSGQRLRSLGGVRRTIGGGFAWTVRHRPGDPRVVRSAAWDSDGRCLAATSTGLAFWNGNAWQLPTSDVIPAPERIHFVRRVDAGTWLLGGDGAVVYACRGDAVEPLLEGRDPAERFTLASGDVDDLAVFVGEREGEPPRLHAVAAGHWVKPAALTRASSITSLARLDGERWLLTGRATTREGFAAIYTPLEWEVKRVRTPPARAYLAAAARPELGLGIITGTEGRVLRFIGDQTFETVIGGEPDLAAAALDAEGRAWAASLGRLWTMDPEGPGPAGAAPTNPWRVVWSDARWEAPFVSLFADVGRVIAMTADGGILEGRFEPGRG